MKIELLVSRAGVGFAQAAGEEIDVSDDEGKRMMLAGQARPVQVREKAVKKQASEKAAE